MVQLQTTSPGSWKKKSFPFAKQGGGRITSVWKNLLSIDEWDSNFWTLLWCEKEVRHGKWTQKVAILCSMIIFLSTFGLFLFENWPSVGVAGERNRQHLDPMDSWWASRCTCWEHFGVCRNVTWGNQKFFRCLHLPIGSRKWNNFWPSMYLGRMGRI